MIDDAGMAEIERLREQLSHAGAAIDMLTKEREEYRMRWLGTPGDSIDQAVAAERERCAQVADAMNSVSNIGGRIRYGLGNEVLGKQNADL